MTYAFLLMLAVAQPRQYSCILMHDPTVGDYRCFASDGSMFRLRADHIEVTILGR